MYSIAASLKYDKLFRQAEATNKQQTLRLDAMKTCWFGVSRILHFGPDNNPLPTHGLGLQLEHLQHTPKLQVAVITMLSTQPTHHQTRRCARGSTLDSVSREQNVPLILPLGSQAAVWSTPPRPAPMPLLGLRELQQAHTPLQRESSQPLSDN